MCTSERPKVQGPVLKVDQIPPTFSIRVACRCVYQREDEAGGLGVALTKDIVSVSAKALQRNLTLLGPLVLPVSEQAKLAWDWLMRALGGRKGKAYVPDFRKAFTHFCLHAGERALPHIQTHLCACVG